MTPSSAPRVSVVVPFYNRRHEVADCLGSILGQRTNGFDFEIVAVDNMSTDGTLEELRQWPVRVVECDRRGPAPARNAGIAAARGEIVAFTDSDCVVEPHWLRRLTAPLRRDARVLLAGGRIRARRLDRGVAFFAEAFGMLNQERLFRAPHTFPSFFATANAAYRRDALERVGGFDEALWMCEDADLAWRVLDLGGGIAYCPEAVVRHAHRESFDGLFRQARDYGEGAAALAAKHRTRLGPRPLLDYNAILRLALTPAKLAWDTLAEPNPVLKKWALYEAVYHTGYLLGRWKGSWKHRVWML
ncbi:MAG: glycosyltransferase [Candidatus Sumerlaeia bacterium]|nr:glycosyltransferase [Candidatus Sumerlaeia bacterium]